MLPTERMLNRRGVLGAGAALAAALCCRPWPMLRRAIAEPTPASGPPRHMALGTWQVIAAVQELLLPPDDLGPGASDVNAIGYGGVAMWSGILIVVFLILGTLMWRIDRWQARRG